MRMRLLAIAVILFASVSAAQSSNTDVDPEPGLVKAGGLMYGLDVAFDNGLQEIGLKSPGEVAFERASEVSVAEGRNNSGASRSALNQFNRVVDVADNGDVEGLERAESVLVNVSSRVPEEAQQGVETALENVRDAKSRTPAVAGGGGVGGDMLPDIELPDVAGDDNLTVPGEASQQGR